MRNSERPLPLKSAPLRYSPENELGVVFLFSKLAKKLQFRIERIRAAHPDCVAYRYSGEKEKLVRIEFEFRSSNFKTHRHDASQCDCIVCWHHDWPDVPRNIETIELKRYYDVSRKVWIQQAIKAQSGLLDDRDFLDWALSTRATPGDLLLMYRAYPDCCIKDIYRFAGDGLTKGEAAWRDGECYAGRTARVCRLDAPVFLTDLRNHKVLSTSSFVRRNMQGKALLASEYWHYLYALIADRNPKVRKVLARYAPDKI